MFLLYPNYILIRNYFEENVRGNYGDYLPTIRALPKERMPVVNLIIVHTEDMEAYYAGDAVTTYYVEIGVKDLKAHSAPWGAAQTYVSWREGKLAGNTHSSRDIPTTGRVEYNANDPATSIAALYDIAKSENCYAYMDWAYPDNSYSCGLITGNTTVPLLPSIVELYCIRGQANLVRAFGVNSAEDLCLVGILVFDPPTK